MARRHSQVIAAIEVPAALAERLRREASKRGQRLSVYVAPALEALLDQHPAGEAPGSNDGPMPEPTSGGDGRPISELIDDIWRPVAPEELAGLPRDLAENLDHYVYGTERRVP